MIKKLLLGIFGLVIFGVALLWFLGTGPFGQRWVSSPAVAGPRPAGVQEQRAQSQTSAHNTLAGKSGTGEILFGDLHVHTSFSADAAVFGLPFFLDSPVVMPSDACDFARYCSALDFWSINDHAEGMTPRSWQDSVEAIRDCNAQAGDPTSPDMISLVGWEWSQGGTGDGTTHYGHKNVIFREWGEGRTPVRPISSSESYMMVDMLPALARGALSLNEDFAYYQGFADYFNESSGVDVCDYDKPSSELPVDCREVALNPTDLYRKLDELGYDSLVIPHGLAWGRTNPRDADFASQLPEHNPRYQTLIETYSGHGNSEVYADFNRRVANGDGSYSCAEATDDFVPCCQRAGELIRARCEDPLSLACEARVEDARHYAAEVLDDRARTVVSSSTVEDWGNCGQLLNSFLPAWYYVPTQSTQYNLALGDFSRPGKPRRARFGIMASSDVHKARPGTGYKEVDRTYMTDTKDVGKSASGGVTAMFGSPPEVDESADPALPVSAVEQSFLSGISLPNRIGSFYYTGGLIGVHTGSRTRDELWSGIAEKHVYGTSGERMLLWFNLLNGANGEVAMGSEVTLARNPRFRVRALGSFRQLPGCPEYSRSALGDERIAELCRGECYHPGDERKAITRIEVIRIRPQIEPDEPVAALIEDAWKVFDCPAVGGGCEIEFEDEDFLAGARETLYYVRAIQEAQPTINGDNYRCDYNAAGECIMINFCRADAAQPGEDCLAPAEPRAWSSPIFIDYRG